MVDSAKFGHGHKSTAFALLRPENLCCALRNERSTNKKMARGVHPLAIREKNRFLESQIR
jgi:hypothetical protein